MMAQQEAHPIALQILRSTIYWNTSEATLPFYNEDALEILRNITNWSSSDVIRQELLNYLKTIGHGDFDYFTIDAIEIDKYNAIQNKGPYFATFDEFMAYKEEMMEEFEFPDEQEALFDLEFGNGPSDAASIQIDQTIIAVVFASFVKNGELSKELIQMGMVAIQRELLEISLLKFEEEVRNIRISELKVLFHDLCLPENL
jgi:uncharacterized protein YfeS